ncbi:MAG: M14 family zinc carboxypeptidase, partial [Chloroflexota bacterium]
MERADWLVYPWQVDLKVREWLERYPQLVQHQEVEQYTRHKVHALTVTDSEVPADAKRSALFFVPHAHEPAGTAACMNCIQQLLTGHHLDGAPSTLQREAILRQAALTFIPDGNPYGRARCPEPWWDGRRYNNREFINMVFGIGDLYSDDPAKPRRETFKRVGYFRADVAAPARIGLVYEQIGQWEYIEPNRGDPRGALARLVAQLAAQLAPTTRFDLTLNLHQTEFEGAPERENCMVILPALQPDLPRPEQQRNEALAEAVLGAWRGVG